MSGQQKTGHDDLAAFERIISAMLERGEATLSTSMLNSLSKLQEALASGQLDSLDGLLQNLEKSSTRKSKSRTGSRFPETTKTLVNKLNARLEELEYDESEFEIALKKINGSQNADTMKQLAFTFTRGGKPGTKQQAFQAIKTERNRRRRAEKKVVEAANARPW